MHQNNNIFKPKNTLKNAASLEPFSFKLTLNNNYKIDEYNFTDSVKTGNLTRYLFKKLKRKNSNYCYLLFKF